MAELTKREDVIVRWLEARTGACQHNCDCQDAENVADAIRDGEHLKWVEQYEGQEAAQDDRAALLELVRDLAALAAKTSRDGKKCQHCLSPAHHYTTCPYDAAMRRATEVTG